MEECENGIDPAQLAMVQGMGGEGGEFYDDYYYNQDPNEYGSEDDQWYDNNDLA